MNVDGERSEYDEEGVIGVGVWADRGVTGVGVWADRGVEA